MYEAQCNALSDLEEGYGPETGRFRYVHSVISIIGGAIFFVSRGKIIDNAGDDIQKGYIVSMLCFFVVLFFGSKGLQFQTKS